MADLGQLQAERGVGPKRGGDARSYARRHSWSGSGNPRKIGRSPKIGVDIIKPNTRYMLATMVKILNRVPSPCFTRGARSGGGYGDPPRRDDGGGYGDPPRRDDEQSGGVAHLSCAS